MRRARGFTIIEVLAVMALIALAATVVVVSVGDGLTGAKVRAASRDLVAALRYTRGQAIVKREQKALTVDVEQRRFQAPGRPWVDLPKDMDMKLFTARSELAEDGVGGIRFFPDGASTGGHIDLIRGEATWRVDVNWLTGEIRMIEGGEVP